MKYSSFKLPRVIGMTSKFITRRMCGRMFIIGFVLDLNVPLSDDRIFFLSPVDRVSELHLEPFASHFQQAQAGMARRQL
jgi:hypothetical protein